MPTKSTTPGLIRRKRKSGVALWWSAASLTRDLRGFPDPLIRLPSDASPAELADLCETYTTRLEVFLAEGRRGARYDGTIASLCDLYEKHEFSPIHGVSPDTRRVYQDAIGILRATIGRRALRAVVPIDAQRWVANWRAPAKPGGPERATRAHTVVSQLRAVLRFGASLGIEEAGRLDDGLAKMKFARGGRRQAHMTFAQAQAIVTLAARWSEDKPDGLRWLHMGIGVATQFETMLRQRDVIGQWRRDAGGREEWTGAYTWEAIAGGGLLRLQTSKTKATGVYDLPACDLLWPLLQRVPQALRTGAIVKGDHGPMRATSYRKWFRQLARAAGVPDGVWNMDARSGAITEAQDAGADPNDVRRAATHADLKMTNRYDREIREANLRVAETRKAARKRTP